MKEPDRIPFAIEQVGELTGSPDNVQLVSFAEKAVPKTLTVEPNRPEVGSKEIDGPATELVASLEFVCVDAATKDELVEEVEFRRII